MAKASARFPFEPHHDFDVETAAEELPVARQDHAAGPLAIRLDCREDFEHPLLPFRVDRVRSVVERNDVNRAVAFEIDHCEVSVGGSRHPVSSRNGRVFLDIGEPGAAITWRGGRKHRIQARPF
ncbi:MAG: hypothetical protein CL933_00470 [Deltaproteobacteria bacterium]|nr:hypothetical protein [Deltaproteobacteria bacterium]